MGQSAPGRGDQKGWILRDSEGYLHPCEEVVHGVRFLPKEGYAAPEVLGEKRGCAMGIPGVKEGDMRPPTFPPKEGAIATLRRGYTLVNPEGVLGVINGSYRTLTLLADIPPKLGEYFPDASLSLGVEHPSEEGQQDHLLLLVHTPWPATLSYNALRSFSYDWWLARWDHTINISLWFQSLDVYMIVECLWEGKHVLRQHKKQEEEGDEDGDDYSS